MRGALCVLSALALLPMCRTWEEGGRKTAEAPADVPAEQGSGGSVGTGGAHTAPPVPTTSDAGAGGAVDPLQSDVFGAGSQGATGEPSIPACDYSTPGCDFTRLDGCCSAKACSHASGADVFNTYPVESCEALLSCVQSHPECGGKDDPLCFGNEAPDAPCLQEGYLASHTDPDGPFAWTLDLMACVCGY